LVVHILQQVAGLQDGHSTASILEDPSLPLDLILDADVVLVVHGLSLAALPHAAVGLHLHVELGVAVHHAALLDEALERTDFHGQTEGFVGEVGQTVTSDFGLGGENFLLGLLRLVLFGVGDKCEGV
jgi:hypothetical protein